MLRRRRLHRLRPERRGGVLPLPNPALDAGKGRSTCGHQPTNGANWPEARTGLEWWDGGSGCCPLRVSYAPQSGSALAPKKPRAAATAILRIEALAADLLQTAQRAASAKQKTPYVTSSRRTVSHADRAKPHGRIRR